jgi:hypothetical protein
MLIKNWTKTRVAAIVAPEFFHLCFQETPA